MKDSRPRTYAELEFDKLERRLRRLHPNDPQTYVDEMTTIIAAASGCAIGVICSQTHRPVTEVAAEIAAIITSGAGKSLN